LCLLWLIVFLTTLIAFTFALALVFVAALALILIFTLLLTLFISLIFVFSAFILHLLIATLISTASGFMSRFSGLLLLLSLQTFQSLL